MRDLKPLWGLHPGRQGVKLGSGRIYVLTGKDTVE